MNLLTIFARTVAIGTAFKTYNLLGERQKLPEGLPYLTPADTVTNVMTITSFVALTCLKNPSTPIISAFGICCVYGMKNTLNNQLQMEAFPRVIEDTSLLQLKFSTIPIEPGKVVSIIDDFRSRGSFQTKHSDNNESSCFMN